LRSLRRIERQTRGMRTKSELEMYWLSVSIQAVFIAYMVCSFFGSIQYLWPLYYTAAYAVALRRIHTAEDMGNPGPHDRAPKAAMAAGARIARGSLWRSFRTPKGNQLIS